jgi:UDP-4-amino-4,6-dideoxy-N-acetyl-beta-L-altrosamine transaminase
MIPYGRQSINEDDINEVRSVLKSEFLTQGPLVPEFEKIVSQRVNANYAVAVNSGTSALHVGCLALGLRSGDILWTSPITFVASANCGLYCGASVDFVDIDPSTYNLCPDALEAKLIYADKVGQLPKVLVAVHLCGQSCEMKAIRALSLKYGFKIIEDASHAIGGNYQNEPIGSCINSDITVFSFHPVKVVTTGEGGMCTTNDSDLAEKMAMYRSHGITKNKDSIVAPSSEEIWNYQQIGLGFNYRMSDIQAALGISQMKRLDDFVSKRHVISNRYNSKLKDLPVITPWQHPDAYSGMHLYIIKLNLNRIKNTHKQVYYNMIESGIGVNLHYIPVYRHPYFTSLGFRVGYCPEAENYFLRAISLPIFPSLNEGEQNQVIESLKLALN